MEFFYFTIPLVLVTLFILRDKLLFTIYIIFNKNCKIIYINPLILLSSNNSILPDVILFSEETIHIVKIVSSYESHIKYVIQGYSYIEVVKYYMITNYTDSTYINIKFDSLKFASDLNTLESIKPYSTKISYVFLPSRYNVAYQNVHNMLANKEEIFGVNIHYKVLGLFKNKPKIPKKGFITLKKNVRKYLKTVSN